MGQRRNRTSWQFPQGGVVAGETPLQAMYRELYEEIGLRPQDVEVIASTRDITTGTAIIISSYYPVVVMIGARIFLKESITTFKIVGFIIVIIQPQMSFMIRVIALSVLVWQF
ncbi:hypothetical protein ACH24_00295 [Francisella persica ATCC VR-331]|uniref:Nudix hydrolase domain-containing protein n=1 Tax=Francisella persica ATCC VR-331 TaxID=1086726 RepID=A0AAC8ZMD7_9GAMM|nr:hypothetical protein ACH24_00295 [Francisella persica ATCC VR-331]ANH77569.1 hypothetical protein FSC845_03125 [Francisella persica ATCC VR-331]